MTIGIDASRAFMAQKTGTEEYSYQLITQLLQLPQAAVHDWVLYVKSRPSHDLVTTGVNVKLVVIKLARFWTQLGLAARTWMDGLDVLWVPAHTLPVLRRPGLTTVVTIHGIEYEWLPAYENALQRLYLPLSTHYAVRSASKIIAVSRFTGDQLVARLGADPQKIAVVHEGVVRQRQESRSRELAVLRKYQLAARHYLLFMGTIQPRKNLVRLMEAFAQLADRQLKLVLIGKLGWAYAAVLGAPQRLGITSQVGILGYISSAESNIIMRNALVYVQPSLTEGFGLPVLEAMAAGVPVVSSSGGALPEVVGDAAVLFNPFDSNEMARQLSRVVSNYRVRKQLVSWGYLRVKQFSWTRAARETLDVLENAK